MIRHLVSTLLTLPALVATPLAAAPASAPLAPAAPSAFYQFDGDRLRDLGLADANVEARIVYELDGRALWTRRYLIYAEAGDKVTFALPDPIALRRADGGAGELAIRVYAGDLLLDTFDPASFRAYNRTLIRSQGAELERLLAGWSEEPDAAPEDAPVAGVSPPAELVGPSVGTRLFGGCEESCRTEYRECIRISGSSDCDDGLYWCLLSCPDYDSDWDGVPNGSDNCLQTANPGQANCDGDSAGDACDSDNGIWQTIVPVQTCWTDRDDHVIYYTFEHHVETKERDVSACGKPDRWRRWIRDSIWCTVQPDHQCCMLLAGSISAVGDDPEVWCTTVLRDRNHCH